MNETEAREFMNRYFNAAFNQPVDVYLDLFRPDALLEDPVGMPPYHGREAIQRLLQGAKEVLGHVDFEVRDVFVCGGEIAARWWARFETKRGDRIAIDGIGTFTFDEDSKLRHVREFYDASLLRRIFSSGG